MIYPLSLETALLMVGLALVVSHGFALLKPELVQGWLRKFPRSTFWGTLLIVVSGVWFWWLVSTMDLHEFSNWRNSLKIGTPIAVLLTWRYVPEFLSVRALGILVLLGAEVLLEAAWMRPEAGRLWLVSLVYLWITAAIFWVGMPYVLRDQIEWVSSKPVRWKGAAAAGIAYGAILMMVLLTLRR
jgi:hypothetical protein